MARTRDRVTAGFFAAIFIISTLALTATVLISVFQDNNNRNNGAASIKETTNPTQQEANMNPTDQANQLQGKPLANFTPVENVPELQKTTLAEGDGAVIKAEDTITVDYTGAVASTGTVFQSSLDAGQPATFPLSDVIAGWTQGIPGTKVGSTIRLAIPAELAYGANPPQGSGIPANADLVFDIIVRGIANQ